MLRSNSPLMMKAHDSTKVASAATRMIGSFFGQAGVFETTALEMMRASGAADPMLSRADASRYFAK